MTETIRGLKPPTLERSYTQMNPAVFTLLDGSADEDLHKSSPSPVSKLLEELSLDCSVSDETADSAVINGTTEDQIYSLFEGNDKGRASPSPPQSCESSPSKQPPAVSKKPKLSFVPSSHPHLINECTPAHHEDSTSQTETEDRVDAPQSEREAEIKEEIKDEEDQEDSTESWELLTEKSEAFIEFEDEFSGSASPSQETSLNYELCSNGDINEEEDEEGDGTSSIAESISSKEDDTSKSTDKHNNNYLIIIIFIFNFIQEMDATTSSFCNFCTF